MRTLKTEDLFNALRVVKAIGVKDEIVELATALNGKTKQSQEEIGAKLLLGVLANCGDDAAEAAFYKFISGPTEKTPDELKNMELMDFAVLLREMIAFIDLEAWRGFFQSLKGILKKS